MESLLTIRTSAAVYFEESSTGSCLAGSCDRNNQIFRAITQVNARNEQGKKTGNYELTT